MTTITLDKAQQDLPDLIKRVLAGEEIVIEAGGRLVRLAPSPVEVGFNEATARRRGYGSMKGQLIVGPEFFEPLSDEECGYGDGKDSA
jgi:antitoxin (DNA-binding transcriptional repressor) of toxin-antitoxin stability system